MLARCLTFFFDRRENKIRLLRDSILQSQNTLTCLLRLKDSGSESAGWLIEAALRRKEEELRYSRARLEQVAGRECN
jgi:hypothetical protein